jgi:cathepsin L
MKASTVIVLLGLVALATAALPHQTIAFKQWMHEHQKTYETEAEFHHRLNIFVENSAFVRRHNREGHSFTVALNKFADLTNEEFREMYNKFNKEEHSSIKTRDHVIHSTANVDAPASYDWRKKNAVTHVKNQEQCGSCWSFSTTGSVEGCHAISTGKLVSLSEQNLMDCSTSYGNEGCDGGLMVLAYEYIIANGGIDTEASYNYTAEDGTCEYNAANSGATINGYENVTSGDEKDLLNKGTKGPVSVAIDASQNSFQFYSSGVYSDPGCGNGPNDLDHGVLVVGWGVTSNGTDYWIVKNSWGADWGLSGYLWMARNDNNMCGIATEASIPTC